MKSFLHIAVLMLVLMAGASRCIALVELADVSKEQAKEMGVVFRSHPNGDAGTLVQIEFKTAGALKNFTHVRLEIRAEGPGLYAPLEVSRPTADSVSTYFSGDPSYLAKSIVTIMVHDGERTNIGYRFKVSDFIDLQKSR